MPLPSPNKLSPINTPQGALPPNSETSYEAEFLTFGLPGGWLEAYRWACKSGVRNEWARILITTRTEELPITFGTVLSSLVDPTAFTLLEHWRDRDHAAQILHRLAIAARRYPEVFDRYASLPTEVPAVRQLKGQSESKYLLLLLMERYPPATSEQRIWLVILRLWALVHAIDRSFHGNVNDKHLLELARRLRIACQRGGRDLIPFLGLQCPSDDLDDLNQNLIALARQSIANKSSDAKNEQALNSLIQVAQRLHDQIPVTEGRKFRLLNHEYTPAVFPLNQYVGDSDENFGSGAETRRVQVEDESLDVLSIEVEEELSPAQQRLSANSVLLASAEDIQFLPWAWNRPNPLERVLLDRWIDRALGSSEAIEVTLAALVWIAIACGLSLRRALDIRVGTLLSRDWMMDAGGNRLIREPPSRMPGWSPGNANEEKWVAMRADSVELPLPESVRRVVSGRLRCTFRTEVLGDLWDRRWNTSPEQAFREKAGHGLSRVMPGMLGQILPQRIFEETGDGAFARLLSSRSNSGLPGSCAYASWTVGQVVNALRGNAQEEQSSHLHLLHADESERTIAAGSRLDPLEDWLQQAIAAAGESLNACRRGADPVAFHNALTLYVTMALLAGTGGRVQRDPFESRSHFDLQERFVYIDDKASGNTRQGRLVPLVDWLPDFFGETYSRHLGVLASLLAEAAPELSAGIAGLAFDRNPAGMPYLFLLDGATGGPMDWCSVSESEFMMSGLFDWPLPFNLFRHRLARVLRDENMDSEIIDGILGHAELGAASYGDNSTRVWQEDMAVVRPAMTRVFRRLGFVRPESWEHPPARLPKRTTHATKSKPRLFGIEARAEQRRKREERTREDVAAEIRDYLNGRDLSDLDATGIDELSRKMLFYPNGLPRPTAGARYHLLMEQLEAIWTERDHPPSIRKRYLRIENERSPFTVRAAGVIALQSAACRRIEEGISGMMPTRLSRRNCGLVAALLLCAEHRIANATLLESVAHGRNVRLVSLGNRVYLEYAEGLARTDTQAAVQRYEISYKVARYLDRGLGGPQRGKEEIPQEIIPLVDLLAGHTRNERPDSVPSLLKVLADVADQVNAQTLPGIMAGYLAGRVSSSSLNWCNWIRVMTGRRARLPDSLVEEGEAETVEMDAVLPAGPGVPLREGMDRFALQQNAHRLYGRLRNIVSGEMDELPTHVSGTRRRDIQRSLGIELKGWSGKVSPAIIMLGQWLVALVVRMRKRTQHHALSTVLRYFGALSPLFEQIAYDSDLLALDEDGVTTLYGQLLEAASVENLAYVVDRLREFHRWARMLGMENPDWSQLTAGVESHYAVSPGVIVEYDYIDTLRLLVSENSSSGRLAAFLLLCAYRFGLRGAEALWLAREDWVCIDGQIVVLIQKNRVRLQKTPSAIRQVPLVFNLTPLERNLADQILSDNLSRFGGRADALLFARENEAHAVVSVPPLKRLVNLALWEITGDPGLTLHDARHSFANALGMRLFHPPLEHVWLHFNAGNDRGAESLLMARTGNSRRRSWGLSRAMGHARPSTALKSYVHFLGEWVGALLPPKGRACNPEKLETCLRLDDFPVTASVELKLKESVASQTEEITVHQWLKYARLLALGKMPQEAASHLNLPDIQAREFYEDLKQLNRRFVLNPSQKDPNPGSSDDPVSFLRRLGESAWQRLLKHASTVDEARSNQSYESASGKVSLVPVDVMEMIGPHRHLVCWEEKQLGWARELLDALKIPEEMLVSVHTTQVNPEFLEAARKYGFEPVSPKKAGKEGRPAQPDIAFPQGGKFHVKERLAISFVENSAFDVRNSIEFVLLIVTLARC